MFNLTNNKFGQVNFNTHFDWGFFDMVILTNKNIWTTNLFI
jgi:hypothetical protein